jgi:DNA-binding SARP family transcriptional activator
LTSVASPRRKPKLLIKLLALQPNHQLHREQRVDEVVWVRV